MSTDTNDDTTDENRNPNKPGGESAHWMSDGLCVDLENGRTVSPYIRDPETGEQWMATWVDTNAGEMGIGPGPDDTKAVVCLGPSKAVFDDDGQRIWHYEWNGWLWCDRAGEVALEEWEPGETSGECPECGGDLEA